MDYDRCPHGKEGLGTVQGEGGRGHTLVGSRGRRHPQREAGSRPARAFPGGLVSRSVRTQAPVALASEMRCWVTKAPGR